MFIDFPIDMTSGTYYLRPMLITDQVLEKQFDIAREWYVQYGDIRMYNYPKVTIGNITTNSCHYHDSSSEYSVDVTIDATIEAHQEGIQWGVGVYSSNGELLKEISTTSDNAAYSFRYQDILPASSLDSTSHTIKLRAVPFAVRTTLNDKAYGEAKDFEVKKDLCPDDNHPHMIDLGIGAKWACCNVGAHEPEGYGGYYAWGETAEKDDYSKENYLFYSRENISGTQYDAARVNWGAPWRMPNEAEWGAFYRNCSSEWTTVNGIYGRRFTGPNGNRSSSPPRATARTATSSGEAVMATTGRGRSTRKTGGTSGNWASPTGRRNGTSTTAPTGYPSALSQNKGGFVPPHLML